MSNYIWITFDCYGTLIDWELGIAAAFEKMAMATGLPFNRNQVLKLYRKYEKEEEVQYRRYRDVLTRVARRVCFDLGLQTATYDFLADSLQRWRPFPDTNAALQRLARKHKLGILSNVDNDMLALTRKHLTVNFDLIVTAEDVSSYKPGLKHFEEAKRKIANADWIHAAQSYVHDILPCNRLGIESAWINRTHETLKDNDVKPLFNGPDLYRFANWIEGVDSSPNLLG
ncbi:HAD-IA family hydrolase [bacterium]|nr:HAD-IA family hydrolase [bacterium]